MGVEVNVFVGVAVFVNVLVGGMGVFVKVFVAVAVFVNVFVAVAVYVGVLVAVNVLVGGTGVFEAIGVNVLVSGTGVRVGVVAVGVFVAVLVTGVGVAVAGLDRRLNAASRSRRPYPYELSGPASPRSTAELTRAASCSAADRFGKAESSNASPPATCGAASDVPVGL